MNTVKPGDHLSTFGGNPVSCAAGLANMDFFEQEKLADQALKKGEYLKTRLSLLKAKYNRIGEIRGKGLMVGIELIRDRNKTPANIEGDEIRDFCLGKGVLVGLGGVFGNVLRIQPPLVISEKQMDQVVTALDEAFKKI